ncbi:hypothetical protein ES703_31931 [subsurface metagenome]
MITKRVDEVMGKCINFNDEFHCPGCRKLLVPVCVNLGTIKAGKGALTPEEARKYSAGEFRGKLELYCSRNFPPDCSKYGCPKYSYVGWLERYRQTGRL